MDENDYYEVGQSVYFWTEVHNRLKQLADPDDLELHIQPPGAVLIVVPLVQLVHESLGRYSYTFVVNAQGLWRYAFHSHDPTDVDGDRFHVSNSSQP